MVWVKTCKEKGMWLIPDDAKNFLVSLFTRSRRFGKTLNRDMLRVFFGILNEDTSKYFVDKNIWK